MLVWFLSKFRLNYSQEFSESFLLQGSQSFSVNVDG